MQQVICKGIFHYPITHQLRNYPSLLSSMCEEKLGALGFEMNTVSCVSFYVDFAGLT